MDIIKYHGYDNLENNLFCAYSSRGLGSVMVGTAGEDMVAGTAGSSHLELQVRNRENSKWCVSWNLRACPQFYTSSSKATPPNPITTTTETATNLGPSIQMPVAPRGHHLIQTATSHKQLLLLLNTPCPTVSGFLML